MKNNEDYCVCQVNVGHPVYIFTRPVCLALIATEITWHLFERKIMR